MARLISSLHDSSHPEAGENLWLKDENAACRDILRHALAEKNTYQAPVPPVPPYLAFRQACGWPCRGIWLPHRGREPADKTILLSHIEGSEGIALWQHRHLGFLGSTLHSTMPEVPKVRDIVFGLLFALRVRCCQDGADEQQGRKCTGPLLITMGLRTSSISSSSGAKGQSIRIEVLEGSR